MNVVRVCVCRQPDRTARTHTKPTKIFIVVDFFVAQNENPPSVDVRHRSSIEAPDFGAFCSLLRGGDWCAQWLRAYNECWLLDVKQDHWILSGNFKENKEDPLFIVRLWKLQLHLLHCSRTIRMHLSSFSQKEKEIKCASGFCQNNLISSAEQRETEWIRGISLWP